MTGGCVIVSVSARRIEIMENIERNGPLIVQIKHAG